MRASHPRIAINSCGRFFSVCDGTNLDRWDMFDITFHAPRVNEFDIQVCLMNASLRNVPDRLHLQNGVDLPGTTGEGFTSSESVLEDESRGGCVGAGMKVLLR